MATERRRAAVALAGIVLAMLCTPLRAHADAAWWEPLGFPGQRVSAVSVDAGGVHVAVTGSPGTTQTFVSRDHGRSFVAGPAAPSPPATPGSSGVAWSIRGGVVLTGAGAGGLHPDPGAPYLGAAARLIAAPAATPGVVVAVGSDNHVWRRAPSGAWATAFVLLPAGGLDGTPVVTSVAAFSPALSAAVYLGVDGYGVLVSSNGGDDWIRADPGLPQDVLGLATDAPARALYAATDQGLYVHHLQSFPAPPRYQDAALRLRWLGIAAVSVVVTLLGVLALRRVGRAAERRDV